MRTCSYAHYPVNVVSQKSIIEEGKEKTLNVGKITELVDTVRKVDRHIDWQMACEKIIEKVSRRYPAASWTEVAGDINELMLVFSLERKRTAKSACEQAYEYLEHHWSRVK